MPISTTEEIIADIHQGKMVILMDDEDRENEGDLVMAAARARPEDINFMARYGRGLICLTLESERCRQLRLPLMVTDNNTKHGTNFTVSIEAAEGVTTGISTADRALTIQKAVAPDARPSDLVQPGHIFPLMAQSGGVLERAGHTEAGCDLARLAGLTPASVIVEILNEDGTMARRPDLEVFAREHNLKIGTIADLIHYRILCEHTVERLSECSIDTEFGKFRLLAYRDNINNELHLALMRGDINPQRPALVRVHLQNTLSDVVNVIRDDLGMPLRSAMRRIADEGTGVIVVLRRPEVSSEILQRIKDYHLQDQGINLPRQEASTDLRTYGVGARILADLGVGRMRILGAPRKVHALSGFGLEVVEYVEAREKKKEKKVVSSK